jgi:hypothetical protein
MLFTTLLVTALAAQPPATPPPPVTLEDGQRLPGPEACRLHLQAARQRLAAIIHDRNPIPGKTAAMQWEAERVSGFWEYATRYHEARAREARVRESERDRTKQRRLALLYLRKARGALGEEDWKAGRWPFPKD